MKLVLTPEEVSMLRESCRRKKEIINKYEEYFKSPELVGIDSLLKQKELLYKSRLLKKRTVDSIDIGTKFTVKMIGQEVEEYMLVEEELKIGEASEENHFLSKNSKIGKLVFGKKAGSLIEKIVENGNRIVLGQIVEIKTDSRDYLHYIREQFRYQRAANPVRTMLTGLHQNPNDKELLEKWQEWQTISASQYLLLKEEKRNLLNTAETPQEKRRLTKVKKLLLEKEIIPLPTDGTIGIGTEFSIMMASTKGLKTKRVELINEAITNETEDEYLERISPMGYRVFGLKEGESFKYRNFEGDIVEIIVFDIDNEKKYEKTNSALVYHVKNVKKGGLVKEQFEMLETELVAKTEMIQRKKEERRKAGPELLRDREIEKLQDRITEINHLLTDQKLIINPNSDTIDIGSKCRLLLEYEDWDNDCLEVTLVDRFVSHEASSEEFVSMEKEIGQSLYGKKKNEPFSYMLPNGKIVTGEVLDIIKTAPTEKKPMQKAR